MALPPPRLVKKKSAVEIAAEFLDGHTPVEPSPPLVVEAPAVIIPQTVAKWTPRYACCWCDREFIQIEFAGRSPWVCPSQPCQQRQFAWKMLDINGVLFYLPLPKQVEIEEAIHSQRYGFVCIGGSRGGGKSNTLRVINYRYAQSIENFTGYFLRREFPQLIKNHTRQAIREAKRLGFKFANMTATFPESGGIVEFSHCQDPDDYKNYIGAEADLVTFDQLEQFIRIQFTEISAAAGRIRRKDWRGLVLAGENPGGPLSAFVDELFITKNVDAKEFPDYDGSQYCFVAGNLEDNPYVDPRYVTNLAAIDPVKRDMYRFGKRDVFPGQYFSNFVHPKRIEHLDIPDDYPRIGGFHWGYFRSGIMLWAVVLPDGRLYIERELTFEETIAKNVAHRVVDETSSLGKPPMGYIFGNPPSDAPEAKLGEDVFETLHHNGLSIVRSEHDPVSGWQRLQHWLIVDGEKPPALIIDPSCLTLLKTMPQLIQEPNDIEDVDDSGATSPAKALRYIVMSRPTRNVVDTTPVGRDLSKVDARTRNDIEAFRRHEAREAETESLSRMDNGWPFGNASTVRE